ncbi:H-2 class II histocompatibility antigen, E-S beta chain-like isoform X1 [Rhineura floridana]|uniref:H-2 class II histocompatibility antigen, E-S beta chain-like isoform X1 n=1 Tax=Rhineura floridana TaxID=261503 RepID=UPI002AC84527|nr:H-2 class II histocompatibility antigen, E-S beta chain-like isoform X1 [Rhineura floridana]
MVGTCALDLGVLLGAAVLVVLVSPPEVLGVEEPPEHFLFQSKGECHYSVAPNGTLQRVRYLDRYFWDRQELARFDSDIGTYVAVGELGEIDAQKWNRDKDRLRSARDDVECFCRHNYGNFAPFASARRVHPKVMITPTEYDSVSHNALLICDVAAFYPTKIEIKWFRNGEEETRVWTTDLTRNGDWTFQIQVMLEVQPERGDVYTCQVEHASFEGPITVQWEAQSDSAKSKMWTGIVGLVLGLAFVAPGLFLCMKNKKGGEGSTRGGSG